MAKNNTVQTDKLRPLQRFALYFFRRPRRTSIIMLAVIAFGVLCFTTLMKREGFPAMNIPYAVGQVVYTANDAAVVDAKVAKPLSDFLLKQDGVKSVTTNSSANFAVVSISFKDGVDATAESKQYLADIKSQQIVPAEAQVKIDAAKVGFTNRGDDAAIAVYDVKNPNATSAELLSVAESAASYLEKKNISQVESVAIVRPIETVVNPATNQTEQAQTSFDRYGVRENGKTTFYHSVTIGVLSKADSDALDLDHSLRMAADDYNKTESSTGFHMAVSASYARGINQQMSELQRTLLEGLLAVLIIGSIIIAFRASLITVISMVAVVASTFGVLYILGFTANTIVLFSIILGLALIVDDTIIVVEAIDKERQRSTNIDGIVATSVGKVGRAMIAATTTAALSFAPLLFVGGVIGQFVKAVPTTIMSALFISLIVSLMLIPLLARYIMLRPKHLGAKAKKEKSAGVELAIAQAISKPMMWARHSRKKEIMVGLGAILLSLFIIGAGVLIAAKVRFNIFPPTKDTNRIAVSMQFPEATTITQAESYTDDAVKTVSKSISDSFVSASSYGSAGATYAWFDVNLVDYSERAVTAPELVDRIEKDFATSSTASVTAEPIDIGPPAADFQARIQSDTNREGAAKLAADIAKYLQTTTLERIDGSTVNFDKISVANSSSYVRNDGKSYIGVTASFKDEDTSNLVTLTKSAVEKEFPETKVESYGLDKAALTYDFGQEDDNQQSFKTMLLAFPVLLLVIYLVLAVEFRSLLQPLIIFMAIPFSFFGIALGLYLTDNEFSFFALLGFFALIGLSIKNTILLTDYANQARAAGKSAVEAAHDALVERFRPLIATSLTAIVSLVPLAIASPFWQGLVVVLIGGLLSSTIMVITVFPYYYLGSEYLRVSTRRKNRR